MKASSASGIGVVFACLVAGCAVDRPISRAWPVMGTIARVELQARDARSAEAAVADVRRVFDAVNATMSNWSADSDLSRLNRAAGSGEVRIADPDLAACIGLALDAARRTHGAFDPTVGPLMTAWGFRPKAPRVPGGTELASVMERVGAARVRFNPSGPVIRFERDGMELDLGGIAKGYAVDRARRALAGRGVSGLIDLGGNLGWIEGGRSRREPVALIKDPNDPSRTIVTLRLRPGQAIATSSDIENHQTIDGVTFGHIMDAATGRPAVTDVLQATAIDDAATITDIMSTALFVGGSRRAAELLQAYPASEAVLFVNESGRLTLLASASLRGRLTVAAGSGLDPASPRFVLPAATMPASIAR